MSKRKAGVVAVLVGGIVALVAVVASVQRTSGAPVDATPPRPVPMTHTAVVPPAGVPPATVTAPQPPGSGVVLDEPDATDGGEDMVAALRARYGARIDDPTVQVRMLEELIRYFRERNPARWEEDVLAMLKAAFPERYEELASLLRNWTDYEKWVKDNGSYLQSLGDREKRASLWEMRRRLFGPELADRLWAGELKAQSVVDSLSAINARREVGVTEKASLYKQSLEKAYGEQAPAYLARHQQEAMDRFLDLSSIQQDLSSMNARERAKTLRSVREQMGLDEEALKRWDALDQSRDQRWAAGARYMQEREALVKQFSGEELDAALTALRQRYFSAEADSIASEEASGFFRFNQPRKWGRN